MEPNRPDFFLERVVAWSEQTDGWVIGISSSLIYVPFLVTYSPEARPTLQISRGSRLESECTGRRLTAPSRFIIHLARVLLAVSLCAFHCTPPSPILPFHLAGDCRELGYKVGPSAREYESAFGPVAQDGDEVQGLCLTRLLNP